MIDWNWTLIGNWVGGVMIVAFVIGFLLFLMEVLHETTVQTKNIRTPKRK